MTSHRTGNEERGYACIYSRPLVAYDARSPARLFHVPKIRQCKYNDIRKVYVIISDYRYGTILLTQGCYHIRPYQPTPNTGNDHPYRVN